MQAISTLIKAAVIGLADCQTDARRIQYEQLLTICVDELSDATRSNHHVQQDA